MLIWKDLALDLALLAILSICKQGLTEDLSSYQSVDLNEFHDREARTKQLPIAERVVKQNSDCRIPDEAGRHPLEKAQSVAKDKRAVDAHKALTEAEQLRAEWSAESLRKAITKYNDALLFWRSIENQRQEAKVLNSMGKVHYTLSEHWKAVRDHERALLLSRKVEDCYEEMESLNNLAYVYIALGRNQEALEKSNQALKLSQTVKDRAGQAQALNNVGEVHYALGDFKDALKLFDEALSLWQDLDNRHGQVQTLINLGYIYSELGDLRRALDLYRRALTLEGTTRDERLQARALIGIGFVSSLLGEKQNALDSLRDALQLFRRIGNRDGEAATLNGIGYVYEDIGEKEQAIVSYKEAFKLYIAVGDLWAQSYTLHYIGRMHYALGNREKALESYRQAQSLSRVVGDRKMEGHTLKDIGVVYCSLGSKQTALQYYNKALSLCQSVGDIGNQAETLNEIGHAYEEMGRKEMALNHYMRALPLIQTAQDRAGEVLILGNISRVRRDLGDLAEAQFYLEAALKIVDSLRTKVASQDLRSSYFASVRQHYDLYIDLLMRMHRERPSEGLDATALQASERGRARSLLESLTEARADIRQGIDAILLERERSLQQLLNAKADRQMRLLTGKPDKEEAEALARQIRDLTTEVVEVRGQIRSKSPRYAALTQPQPLSLGEIQQQVLDDESLLLEYALGDDNSYLWAVTKTGMTSHTLPKRPEIERVSRNLYRLLNARQPKPGETLRRYRLRVEGAETEYWDHAALLSEMLLGPVADQLGTKRLLIVADGALQYLPFGALPKPRGEREKDKGESKDAGGEVLTGDHVPLMVDHEIIPLPSASVMAVLRRETQHRKSAPKAVAVLADPVFETDDPRLAPEVVVRLKAEQAKKSKANGTGQPKASSFFLPASPRTGPVSQRLSTPPSSLPRTLRDVGVVRDGLSFSRLLYSGREAKAIKAVAPPGQAMLATDFNASRAVATSPELSQYRIVHFATHGVLNDQHPGLSGVILSLLDEQGRSQDGFLRLHDIYNLKLPADLVVLSACSTALGKDVRGEGLVGIVRGFMYAGAARVVASLWKVDDEATAELMKRFYRYMLQEKMPAAAALRAAQVEMWQQKQWRSPYFWAAFSLQGEWK